MDRTDQGSDALEDSQLATTEDIVTEAPRLRLTSHIVVSPLALAAAYVAIGFAWIVASDALLALIIGETALLSALQTVKGFAFVAVTGTLLFILVRRHVTINRAALDEVRLANVRLEEIAAYPRLNPIPIVLLDADGRIRYANPAAHEHAAAIGEDRVRALLPARARGIARECLATGRAIDEIEHVVRGRTYRWSFFPAGEDGAVYAYGRDVSNEIELGQRLIRAEKLETTGLLAAGVAHDFNNVLTIVKGYAQFLLPQMDERDPIRDCLREILEAAGRAEDLTRRFTAITRGSDSPRVVNLSEEVLGLSSFLRRAVSRHVSLRFDVSEEPVTAEVDPAQFSRAIMNLVINASDAIGNEPGEIVIETTIRREEPLDGEHQRPVARLVVRDDGPGMDETTLERIFEPFFSTKPAGHGTGLGLTVVSSIVDQFGGHLDVQTKPGRGTAIIIDFPFVEGADGHSDSAISMSDSA